MNHHDIQQVAKMTDRNEHCEARVFIAEKLGLPVLTNQFRRIKVERDRLGYLPAELSLKSYRLYKELMEQAEKKLPERTYRALYQAT
jgi:hypothetical protein